MGRAKVFVDTQESCDALFRELLWQNLPRDDPWSRCGQDDPNGHKRPDFKSGDSDEARRDVGRRAIRDVKVGVCVISSRRCPMDYN